MTLLYSRTNLKINLNDDQINEIYAKRKCERLKPTRNCEQFIRRYGVAPFCKHRHCPDCHRIKRTKMFKDLNQVLTSSIRTIAFCYELVLPFYTKDRYEIRYMTDSFLRFLRRQSRQITYVKTIEYQSYLLHMNLLLVTDIPLDCEEAKVSWGNLATIVAPNITSFQGTIRESSDPSKWLEYILKYKYGDPSKFVPNKTLCYKTVTIAKNWNEFWRQRRDEYYDELGQYDD